MLLEHLKIENVENLFRDESQEYFLQIKYDGERSQIHMKDGKFKYFTRNGHDITGKPAYGESSNSGKCSILFFHNVKLSPKQIFIGINNVN